ncbi:MAG: DUF2309 family protein, partial [Verrucomicrobia subdivision 3 bacterium]|nr:DUF2309 family protein [Limisphaerales bacterium]
TEVHEPIRLMLLVQQTPENALRAAQKNPSVYEWILNGWVRYFSITPGTFELHEFAQGEMRLLCLSARVPSGAAAPLEVAPVQTLEVPARGLR